MSDQHLKSNRADQVWLKPDAGSFDEFKSQVEKVTKPQDYPFAQDIQSNVPIYDGALVRSVAGSLKDRQQLMAEWVEVFSNGPGVIAIKNALPYTRVVDRATTVFEHLIAEEKAGGGGGLDHFAKPGANDRVWNVVEKHCLADPDNFAAYYGSDALAMASEAWLGRGYQMTTQVNCVKPGGNAQTAHRDYHLGFMTPAQMMGYPAHIHGISPVLTLQGAVAHCDMPIESGPTMLLPYSQKFFEGYLAFGRAEFQDYFAENHVQVPLEKGDAMFFNPALMHGAGSNVSKDIYRMANLLQVSSAFGRAMEKVDRIAMVRALYPVLKAGDVSQVERNNVIAASAEGYAFPGSLDLDPPAGGLAPATMADIMEKALSEGRSTDEFGDLMSAWAARQP